jgi:two-component system response regulator BaeR
LHGFALFKPWLLAKSAMSLWKILLEFGSGIGSAGGRGRPHSFAGKWSAGAPARLRSQIAGQFSSRLSSISSLWHAAANMSDQAHILVVEDEAHIADVIEYELQEQGFVTEIANDGEVARDAFRAGTPDLVLLDLYLPGIDGIDLFRLMRKERPEVPVIMLTSRAGEVDRILGLEMGADDYVTKPFSPRELTARVRNVLRRSSGSTASDPGASPRAVTLNEDEFSVRYFGHELALTRAEFRLFSVLLKQPARVFSRDDLIRRMYEESHEVTDRSIDAVIKRLRRKCQQISPDVNPIDTVYGIGYKLHHSLEPQV